MTSKHPYRLATAFLTFSGLVCAQGPYGGIKLGGVDVDTSAFDTATNMGVLLGYDFSSSASLSWGLEAELTTSISDGDYRAFGNQGDWDIDTQALYGVFKFGREIYGKVKLGVLREDVSASVGGFSADDTETGTSAGVGVGWWIAPQVAIEAEYTQIEADAAFYSVGANYRF